HGVNTNSEGTTENYCPSPHPSPANAASGSVLLYLVAILTILGVLGAAMLSLSVTSKETLLSANAANRAHYLAESALRIAQRQYCDDGEIPSPLTLQFLSGETATVTTLPDDAGFSVTATAHP